MKGIVFNQLIELVEDKFGLEVADKIINENELASGGSYTSTGTYDHEEILKLVTTLSKETGAPVRDLVMAFGGHLASVFAKGYGSFFEVDDLFTFLKSIDQIIHVEVKKLYPDAELPKFTHEQPSDNVLVLNYKSTRPFADLAEGLIQASAAHFKTDVQVETEEPENSAGTERRFKITKQAA